MRGRSLRSLSRSLRSLLTRFARMQQQRQYSPERAPWAGYATCTYRVPYPVLMANAAARVNWRVLALRPPYGSIYDGSMDPDRISVGYPVYAPHGNN